MKPIKTVSIMLSLLPLAVGIPAFAQGGEDTLAACQDGVDNDMDSFVDCTDQDCKVFKICVESDAAPAAGPAVAPAPAIPAPKKESTLVECKDGIDNDGDGYPDCADQDCTIFTFCASGGGAAPGPVVARPAKEPRPSKGGIGFYLGPFITPKGKRNAEIDFGTELKQQAKMDPAFSLGFFGEGLVGKHFAIGGEAHLAFWNVDDVKMWDPVYEEWSPWYNCDTCETSIAFDLHLRMRFPIPAGKWVALYPIMTVGMHLVAKREDEIKTENSMGVGYSGGFGVEFRTPAPVYPFFEVRYMGGASWIVNKDDLEDNIYEQWGATVTVDKASVIHNSVAINFGTRFM
jgi:hypothetical protein